MFIHIKKAFLIESILSLKLRFGQVSWSFLRNAKPSLMLLHRSSLVNSCSAVDPPWLFRGTEQPQLQLWCQHLGRGLRPKQERWKKIRAATWNPNKHGESRLGLKFPLNFPCNSNLLSELIRVRAEQCNFNVMFLRVVRTEAGGLNAWTKR